MPNVQATASRAVRRKEGDLLSVVEEALTSIRVVKAFAQEKEEVASFRDVCNRYLAGAMHLALPEQAIWPLMEAILLIALYLVLARGVKLPGKVASDPKDLGKVLTDLHEKPGQLRDILGGGQPQGQAPGSNPITEILKSPQAKAVLAGIAAMRSLPIAQYPEVVPPMVQITTTFVGASATDVEASVATPIAMVSKRRQR